MSNGYWTGVRLCDLLERAGVKPGSKSVVFYSADNFADSIPLESALEPETIIAYALNGELLPQSHGAPARLVVPDRYGYKNVKWIERIEVVPEEYRGRWQELGWSPTAIVKTMSRIDTVQRQGDQLLVAGVAFAGDRSLSRVQVRADEGEWVDAALHIPAITTRTWVQWRAYLPARGARQVTARAWDGTGAAQMVDRLPSFPDGASGLHTVAVES